MATVKVGIVGTGTYLPSTYMSAKEIALKTNGVWSEDAVIAKLGIIKKCVAVDPLKEGTQEMGALAAIKCIENTGVNPLDIDVVMSIGEEHKEYPLTTSACYIQGRIGATNAWAIDVQNRCCTCVAAMKIAHDMLVADENCNMILIAGGYRNNDFVNYADKNMSMMYNLASGGGAILLKKNHDRNIIIGSKLISDGSLARTSGVEIGGLVNPITCENLEEAKTSLRLMDPITMKNRLNEVSMTNWLRCVDESLAQGGYKRSDIDYLSILHIKRSGHLGMLEELGLKEEQSVYLEEYGHVGQIDQILSLELGLAQGKIKEGSVVSMIAAGIGYVWSANAIKWGKTE